MPFTMSINFNGNCRGAVTFYAEVFGQDVPYFLTYGEGDVSFDDNVQMTDTMQDKIMYSCVNIEGTPVEFSDMPDHFEFVRGNSMCLSVSFSELEQATSIFEKLSDGGMVFVPFAEIPGQGYYSMFADRFGLTWIIKTIA